MFIFSKSSIFSILSAPLQAFHASILLIFIFKSNLSCFFLSFISLLLQQVVSFPCSSPYDCSLPISTQSLNFLLFLLTNLIILLKQCFIQLIMVVKCHINFCTFHLTLENIEDRQLFCLHSLMIVFAADNKVLYTSYDHFLLFDLLPSIFQKASKFSFFK